MASADPGLGPIIASATVAAIGAGEVFSSGRDFAAWLRFVPLQSRLATAQSWAKYRSAAIAICACCSYRQPGSYL